EPMDVAEVDQPPRKTSGPLPRYPYWARLRQLEGVVTVAFVVDEAGCVREVQVTRVDGDRRFGKLVVDSVKRWRFTAGVYDGTAVPVRCVQRLRFRLED
ncbi:MAG: energy transducer TonB, partial [Planctomycetota bacterium]